MKIILRSKRHHYVARVSIFLVVAALIAGMVGCGGGVVKFNLTIASTAGGSVTIAGEGTFTYNPGAVVNLTANTDACYHFANWTGDVSTVADVNDATTTVTMNSDYSITANFGEEEAVTFADPNLETAIREAIGKPTGSICASDLDGLLSVDALARNITDLTGLEYATSLLQLELRNNQISDISPLTNLTNLGVLWLGGNQVSDISPLANLTNLTYIELWNNQISDISPLANLTSLTGLFLSNNQISDISPLTNLTSLNDLELGDNQISDISPLANLTSLPYLGLGGNQISDISPLADLTSLTKLWLLANQISDISPLVENEGLSTGDTIYLQVNPLSSVSINIYIPQLEARGITVYYP